MDVPADRAQVLGAIRSAIDDRTCVSLVGLPGSGRTSVLAAVRAAAEDDDRHVVAVPGHGGGRPLESLVLAGLVSGSAGTVGPLAVAAHAVAQAASGGPTLFLLDDADALDDTSAAVLASALSRGDTCAVATVRPPYPGTASVDRIFAGRASTVLEAPLMPFEGVARLAHEVLGGPVDADVAGRIFVLSGGLPGLARSIVVEARRAGHLEPRADHWTARRDLWTPALAADVQRLLAGLDDEDTDTLRILAALGLPEVDTLHRLVPWTSVEKLDDRGLLRFVESEDRALVLPFPPVLGDHLRQTGQGARGRRAVRTISAVLGRGREPDDARPGRRARETASPWSSSPEAAVILARVLREHATTRLLAVRDAWEREPTSRSTATYLDALVRDGGHHELIEKILGSTRGVRPDEVALLRCWEAVYRALELHDQPAGLAVLAEATSGNLDALANVVRGETPGEVPGPLELTDDLLDGAQVTPETAAVLRQVEKLNETALLMLRDQVDRGR